MDVDSDRQKAGKIGKGNTFLFGLAAISLPVLFLIAVELFLRLVNYGYDLSLFIEDKSYPGYIYMNPQVSRRFFLNDRNAVRGFAERFKKEKDANTFRIFIVGGSTARGFPYYHNGSFHRMLKYRIQRIFPEIHFEVINLSLTAVNSYALLDFTREIIKQAPDAVVIYAGHNEYYGSLGVGSASRLGQNRSFVNIALYLRGYRLMQLMNDIITGIKNFFTENDVDLKENLMKRMALDQRISYGSELYELGIDQFEQNLDQLLHMYSQNNIPVFIGTVVSNEKDQPPFISGLDSRTNAEDWEKKFDTAKEKLDSGETDQSLRKLERLRQLDSTYAMTHYLIGEIAYEKQLYNLAKKRFRSAKEMDQLRFRAPEAINTVIKIKANSYNDIHLVDVQKKFENYTDHQIVGNGLMLEHLHPNLTGYFLLADAFYDALKDEKMIGNWLNEVPESIVPKEFPITEVDSLYGKYSTMILKEGWPFYEPMEPEDTSKKTLPEVLAGGLAVNQISWDDAMSKLYNHYLSKNNYKKALNVAEAIILEHPNKPEPYDKAGKLCVHLGAYEKALFYYEKVFEFNKKADFARKIVFNLIKLDRLKESLHYLNYLKQSNNASIESIGIYAAIEDILELKKKVEKDGNNITLFNKLAINYLRIGNPGIANFFLNKALAIDPDNPVSSRLSEKL